MADRVTVQALIDANLPDNTTEEITPEKHREVETSLNDNSFNKDSDTAINVNYSPTTPADWNPEGSPAEVKGALDILAARTVSNPSLNIAFVAENGSDVIGEFEIGNPLKPFATIQAAANAVPSSNSMVIVFSGTYATGVNTTKNNFILNIRGCVVNGAVVLNGTDNTIISYSANVTSSSSVTLGTVTSTNLQVFGGVYNGVGVSAFKVFTVSSSILQDVILNSNTITVDADNLQLINSKTTSTNTTVEAIKTTGIVSLSNCKVSGGKNGVRVFEGSTLTISNNCEIEGTEAPIKTSGALTAGERNLKLRDSLLIGGTFGIGLIRETQEVDIRNCTIDAPSSFFMLDTLRSGNKANLVEGCKFLATTQIVDENSYNAGDTGTLNFVNCQTNLAITTNAKVLEFNTYLNANL